VKNPVSKKPDYLEINLPRFKFGPATTNGYLMTLLLVLTFLIGMLTNKVILLEKELKGSPAPASTAQDTAPQPVPTEPAGPIDVSVDDDPVLGDPNAPVTMIEFSDYECPFCKRYFDQTFEKIKSEYVDTGKLKIVYRDLPLSFHDPLATLEAVAANCARAQGGDTKYFEYHDEIFTRTTSNGNGLSEEDLNTIATDVGLNLSQFTTCLDSEEQKEEVANDIADASTAGATGTPSFFIGKTTSSGTITATKLVGAHPFDSFKQIIEAELEK
jgi:protein-disulfide isomerase